MSKQVVLNLLNELMKNDKMRGFLSILSLFDNEFNKFNNTGTRMVDSIYHMTLGHRPVTVKGAMIGSKDWWKLSTIFKLKSAS